MYIFPIPLQIIFKKPYTVSTLHESTLSTSLNLRVSFSVWFSPCMWKVNQCLLMVLQFRYKCKDIRMTVLQVSIMTHRWLICLLICTSFWGSSVCVTNHSRVWGRSCIMKNIQFHQQTINGFSQYFKVNVKIIFEHFIPILLHLHCPYTLWHLQLIQCYKKAQISFCAA